MPIEFPLTVENIKEMRERSGFPCLLEIEDWEAIVDQALLTMQSYFPVSAYAVIDSVADQSDYYIFDPLNVDEGKCLDALSVQGVWFSPSANLDIEDSTSPLWQFAHLITVHGGTYFNNPSQTAVYMQKMNAWMEAFGISYEVVGMVGSPDAFVRISPTPSRDGAPIIVKYGKSYTLADVQQGQYRYLTCWIDVFAAKRFASYYSETAGLDLVGFGDSHRALNYWLNEANLYEAKAMRICAGPWGAAERS